MARASSGLLRLSLEQDLAGGRPASRSSTTSFENQKSNSHTGTHAVFCILISHPSAFLRPFKLALVDCSHLQDYLLCKFTITQVRGDGAWALAFGRCRQFKFSKGGKKELVSGDCCCSISSHSLFTPSSLSLTLFCNPVFAFCSSSKITPLALYLLAGRTYILHLITSFSLVARGVLAVVRAVLLLGTLVLSVHTKVSNTATKVYSLLTNTGPRAPVLLSKPPQAAPYCSLCQKTASDWLHHGVSAPKPAV